MSVECVSRLYHVFKLQALGGLYFGLVFNAGHVDPAFKCDVFDGANNSVVLVVNGCVAAPLMIA